MHTRAKNVFSEAESELNGLRGAALLEQREAEGKAFAVQQDAAASRDQVVMEAEAKARAVAAIAEALKTGGPEAATAVQLTLAKECVQHSALLMHSFAFVRHCTTVVKNQFWAVGAAPS
jgi:hypothetical protein